MEQPQPFPHVPKGKGKEGKGGAKGGKGKNYSMPPWYNQHFGFPDPLSRDEEEVPEENTLTLPQEFFDLPNDMVHSRRYGFGKGKGNRGGPIVKGKPAYALE